LRDENGQARRLFELSVNHAMPYCSFSAPVLTLRQKPSISPAR
jgi:hypothetical protein